MRSRSVGHALVVLGLVSLAAVGGGCSSTPKCGQAADAPCSESPAPGSFESDLPGDSSGQNRSADAAAESGSRSAAGSAAAPTMAPSATPPNGTLGAADSGASRAIVEADIVQLAGDRIYALSRVAGLAVVDAADPTRLKLLGRYRELPGTPFELYLRDDVAILMFAGWGQYVETDSGDYQYVSTSKIVSLDVSNPAHISVLGTFDVPGTISDSRIVGDVLYVAGFEDGYCWRCDAQNRPTTSVSSLSVADPRAMRKIEELRYSDATGQSSWQRSITVTDQRMYVAGPEYGRNGPIGSTIQVIDISDPAGDLVEGAVLQARGQISSRWQMDEYNGVLRVISQSGQWQTTEPPMLQTFKVVSSKEFQALARLNIVIPKLEVLQSARFDGDRGYLITAERQDPLFTLDLSNPAAPRVVGELEMPGFIYHMEPRGDRVLGLGFDRGNPAGSITVSLFDVSDLATPKMLSRVNFGGDWGSLPEDQDRIHKVFRILAQEGLILVPYSGYARSSASEYCGGENIGGVQLVDYANDTLRLRGSAPSTGQARRALIHKQHLLSVSDERVEAFDITDRSAPKATSSLIMANNVQYAARLDGDIVARVTTPDWDGRWIVELAPTANAEDVNHSLGQLPLDGVFEAGENVCDRWWSIESKHVEGSRLYLLYSGYRSSPLGAGQNETGVIIVDAKDPAKPKLIGQTRWLSGDDKNNWYTYYGDYSYGGFGRTQPHLWHGDTLAFLEQQYTSNGFVESRQLRMRVVDLRDAENPKSTTLQLDSSQQYSGLLGDGDRILTSRFLRPTQVTTNRVKFYIDSFDVSDPSAPKQLPSVNVPGVLVHYDAASGRAITSDLRRSVASAVTPEDCYKRFANAEFNYPNTILGPTEKTLGECVGYTQSLKLVELRADIAILEDTLQLADDQQISAWSAGDDRLFATLSRSGGYYVGTADIACPGICRGGGFGGPVAKPVQLLVLGGFGSGSFAVGRIDVESNSNDWWGFWGAPPIYASGQKALLLSNNEAAIIDAADIGSVEVERTLPLFGSASSVEIDDGTALIALGSQGLQWIEM